MIIPYEGHGIAGFPSASFADCITYRWYLTIRNYDNDETAIVEDSVFCCGFDWITSFSASSSEAVANYNGYWIALNVSPTATSHLQTWIVQIGLENNSGTKVDDDSFIWEFYFFRSAFTFAGNSAKSWIGDTDTKACTAGDCDLFPI